MNSDNKKLIRLPIGISDFKELICGNYQFIDKSLFIKDVVEDGAKAILITRPRRFGKTLNLSMLYYFLRYKKEEEETENLFKYLEISKHTDFCKKHQHQYPVIFISFKDIKQSTHKDAYENIAVLIKRLYEEHRYLLEVNILSESEKKTFITILHGEGKSADINESIKQLSKYLKRKFKESPIILIDEYDTPIQEAYLKKYYDQMIDLMRSILGAALKDNSDFAKGIVTGITKVSQESLFSGVNNLGVYSMLRRKYGQYFGFTESEVAQLISKTKQKVSIELIREWYNGYQIYQYTLYNPWSIISCLINEGELKPYWLNTSSNALIDKLLSNAGITIKQQFEELLQGQVIDRSLSENLVFPDIESKEEALWSLLLYAGYLKVLSHKWQVRKFVTKIAIPNKEVRFVYDNIVEQWFSNINLPVSYDSFVQSVISGNLEEFKRHLSSYIVQTGSYFDFNTNTSEQIFHVFVLGLVVGLRDYYHIHSNREAGLGRFDVTFIPKDRQRCGMFLEFKTSNTSKSLQNKATEALNQIKDRQYTEEFKAHKISTILAIGLAFCGKQMELVYENIDLNKKN